MQFLFVNLLIKWFKSVRVRSLLLFMVLVCTPNLYAQQKNVYNSTTGGESRLKSNESPKREKPHNIFSKEKKESNANSLGAKATALGLSSMLGGMVAAEPVFVACTIIYLVTLNIIPASSIMTDGQNTSGLDSTFRSVGTIGYILILIIPFIAALSASAVSMLLVDFLFFKSTIEELMLAFTAWCFGAVGSVALLAAFLTSVYYSVKWILESARTSNEQGYGTVVLLAAGFMALPVVTTVVSGLAAGGSTGISTSAAVLLFSKSRVAVEE